MGGEGLVLFMLGAVVLECTYGSVDYAQQMAKESQQLSLDIMEAFTIYKCSN